MTRLNCRIDRNNVFFLEFFGALIGDGCLVRFWRKDKQCWAFRVFLTGNASTDRDYFRGYLRGLLSAIGIYGYFRARRKSNKKNANCVDLVVNNKAFAQFLISLEFPVGKKGNIVLPDWVLRLPLKKKTLVLRGIFDTDGCLSARKSENYSRPFVLISSKSKPFRLQLKQIIRELGLPAYESGHLVGINGIQNTLNWFELVGSRNNRNLSRFLGWKTSGKLPMVANKNVLRANNVVKTIAGP